MAMSTSVSNVPLTSAMLEEHIVQRASAVVGLGGIALVHLLDVEDRLTEVPYIGWLFVALIGVSLGLAAALIRSDDRRVWLAAGLLAGATIGGYVITRTVGMPNDGGADIGNWTEPLGMASLMIEGVVVALAFSRLATKD